MKISEVKVLPVVSIILMLAFVVMMLAKIDYQEDTIKDLKSSNADLLQYYTVEKAKNIELEKRSGDRDRMELELRGCLRARITDFDNLEDVKWQMKVVIDTCPGRTRPPRPRRVAHGPHPTTGSLA